MARVFIALTLLLRIKHAVAVPTAVDSQTCGADTSLTACGGSFPSDFCCPYSSICLPLNATGAIATVCCPPGVDCLTIQPTTCEEGAYNASTAAANQVHVSPISALATCGSACCPAGYACQNDDVCVAIATAANSTSTTIATQSLGPSSTASTTTVPEVSDSTSAQAQTQQTTSSSFSGTSFAAGFIPGIVLGILLLAAVFWCVLRCRKRRSSAYFNDKAQSNDQLTKLSPIEGPPRPGHMRSISEPTMLADGSHRTDFLRSSPPDDQYARDFETIDEERESPPPRSGPYQPKPLFQFSPQLAPPLSPLPAHLKRGTLSYAISPIRQLRTKKSVHSLRRHAASPIRIAPLRRPSSIARSNTSASTETIQVLMTPDQRPSYTPEDSHPQETAQGRSRSSVASSIYQNKQPWTTPSRQPNKPQPGLLGSPYVYQPREHYASSTYLDPEQPSRSRRVTTFSSLMEKAGLRREDLLDSSS